MRRLASLFLVGLGLSTTLHCGSTSGGGASESSDAAGDGDASAVVAVDASPPEAAPADAEAAGPVVTAAVISRTHRYIAGQLGMFGGWGPHLGHLVRRANGELWFADDACDDTGPQACDTGRDWRIDYFRLSSGTWSLALSQPLPAGIQQNTGTILDGDTLATYGVDTATSQIAECRLSPDTHASSCADIPLSFPPSTNYVGAAVSPAGFKIVWATAVVDGGGGSLGWIVDYGGGWNGPRLGPVGGYNDASYINVAFFGGTRASQFTMHAELVSGRTPNWTFTAASGDGDSASTSPVAFSVLAGPESDPAATTDDIAIDPSTNDTHLFARTASGAAAYYFRPSGGAFTSPTFVMPSVLRARLIELADGRLVLVYGRNEKGLFYRVAPPRPAGVPAPWAALPEVAVPLPAGYANVQAIYTESAIYERALPASMNVALVGDLNQREVLHVAIAL